MEGKTFYVIEVLNKKVNKRYAYAESIHNSYNLIEALKESDELKVISANACKTLKRAYEIADQWNEAFKEKGIYYFS